VACAGGDDEGYIGGDVYGGEAWLFL